MFDTMTLTKATAGFCGAFLVFLLGKWAATEIYAMDSHGEASYVIEVADAGGAAEVEEVSFTELLATADVGKGAKVFKKCSACHKLESGANATGPYLFGVVGREANSAGGFGYSGALPAGAWTEDALNTFLAKPKDYAPGTSMSFAGLKKDTDRANLIAYLATIQ
ncbi:cytochrome c family protein [Epibacterium ulvae]|uniref:c-type cytochrome n=1 Tax=Epibacterium ulvae TaxID=1156985 RepID=UPI001BFC6AA4|nr:cytochrome c family protein [Epibacterium ulvae]MBT8155347.1 cytochrome c family protein [Epibacterium ulvae]